MCESEDKMQDERRQITPVEESHRETLLRVLEQMMRESGSEDSGFDVGAWLDGWLTRPLPAYGGLAPAEMLRQPSGGLDLVRATLLRMQSGAYS